MRFKEMPESERLAAIKGYEDILTPMAANDQEVYQEASCPNCAGSVRTEADPDIVMACNRPLPKHNCRCIKCGCLFSPFSGVIIEAGLEVDVE